MQYTINVNQEKLADSKLNLVDAAILEYLYHYCNALAPQIESKRIVDDYGIWTWVDYQTLMEEMPILRITVKSSISRRVKTIESDGFIVTKNGVGNRTYIRLTKKCDGLYRNSKTEEPELLKSNTASNKADSPTPVLTDSKTELLNSNSRIDKKQNSIICIDYNTNDSSTKENNKNIVTNVTTETAVSEIVPLEKKEFGDPGINQVCQTFEQSFGHLSHKADQRKYSKILINKFGLDVVLRAANFAIAIGEDKYAPQITCPVQLWNKWSDMIAYGRKGTSKMNNRSVNVSELIRQKKGLLNVT